MSDVYFSVTREFDGVFDNPYFTFEGDDTNRLLANTVDKYFSNFTQPIENPKKMRLVLRLETVRDEEPSE